MPTFTVRLNDAPFAVLHGLAEISGETAASIFRAALTQKIDGLVTSGALEKIAVQRHQEINAKAASLKLLVGQTDNATNSRLDDLITQQHVKLDACVEVLRTFAVIST